MATSASAIMYALLSTHLHKGGMPKTGQPLGEDIMTLGEQGSCKYDSSSSFHVVLLEPSSQLIYSVS